MPENMPQNMPKRLPTFTPPGPQTPQEMELYDQAIFSWVAPEYIRHDKNKNWFLAAAVIVGAVILADVLTNNITMALAVLVFAGVYSYTHVKHPPKDIRITVSRLGIKVGNMIFPFGHIQAFWIVYNPPHITTLNLKVKEHFFSDVVIQLQSEDPGPLREYLCSQIPELEGRTERLGESILRILKF